MEEQKKEFWAIVSLLGHTTMSGFLSEYTMGGASFLKLDIPETSTQPAFSKLFTASSIYSIDPVSEDVARHQAERLKKAPLTVWEADSMLTKQLEKREQTIVNIADLPEGFLTKQIPVETNDDDNDDNPF